MVLRYILKLSIAASLACAATTSYSIKKPVRPGKFISFLRALELKTIVTEDSYGGLDLTFIKPVPKPVRRKKVIKRYNIVVPGPEGGLEIYPFEKIFYYPLEKTSDKTIAKKTTKFGATKKCMKQYENTYYQETLKEFKQDKKKPTLTERYAGVPEAEKKFELLFKKVCGKPIEKATTRDLKLMQATLEKDETLKSCNEAFIQELKKIGYHLQLKKCAEGNEEGYKQAKEDLNNVGTRLYWKNYNINNIIMAALLAGHPKNFKNEEL